jgi:hypothetical protein
MSWFSSLKEKSVKLAQLYKNELSEFMSNLNEDVTKIIGKPEDSSEQNLKDIEIHVEIEENKPDPDPDNYQVLLDFLQPYLTNEITKEELEGKVLTILGNFDDFLHNDPSTLISSSRKDFTNFEEFYDQCNLSDQIYEKIRKCDPKLEKLLENDDIQNKEHTRRSVIRFLYTLVYLFEPKPLPTLPERLEKQPEEEMAVPVVADTENIGDALERKSEFSDQFVVIEDGSSSSHRSSETEKLERVSQRDGNNLSDTDDWQIEEKVIEFQN